MYLEQPGIRVTDLGRSLRFYTRALGLREVRWGDTHWWGGGIWIQLSRRPSAAERRRLSAPRPKARPARA